MFGRFVAAKWKAVAIAAAASLLAAALGWLTARSQSQDVLKAVQTRLQDAADARSRAVEQSWEEDRRALRFLVLAPSFLHDARLAQAGDGAAGRRTQETMSLLARRLALRSLELSAPGKYALRALPIAGLPPSADVTL